MHDIAELLIAKLSLEPHPEGGYYRETYRSNLTVETSNGSRSAGTAILYLLSSTDVSCFHRIDADEIWHFHSGDALNIHSLLPDGTAHLDVLSAENPQVVIPAGIWFGAELSEPGGYALAGCTVSPAFDFAGFEMASKRELLADWPQAEAQINRLT